MNDMVLGWKKIARGMARVRKAANDRAPTLEEIQRMIEDPDRRIKPIVYTMASSGIRIGAWDYLRWEHVSPTTNEKGEIIAAKLLVYAGDPEQYYSFLTPEVFILHRSTPEKYTFLDLHNIIGMQDYNLGNNQELTERALENLRRNAELEEGHQICQATARRKSCTYFNPEKIEPIEFEFNGKKSIRYQYTVIDPNSPNQEKYFTVSKRTSEVIDAHLAERRNALKIHRIGAGKETQYMIVPAHHLPILPPFPSLLVF